MSLLRRTLAGASVLAALAGGLAAAPATAESSGTCAHTTSTRLFTAQNGEFKLWVEKTTPQTYGADEYHVCWKTATLAGGDFVIRSAFRGDPAPTFDYVLNDANCPDFFTLQDPIQLVTELSASNPYDFCVGVDNNRAVRIQLGIPTVYTPFTELWIDNGTSLTSYFCNTSAVVNELYYRCGSYYDGVNVLAPRPPR
ncbi:MAG TPA: hypothetical protein VNQ77_06940 [Frankiaceae bacterium]|nr:hypothetical protein [Frankiaceae bacterium]